MANKNRRDKADEVIITEDEAEEVVRLDAPKWVPVERKVADSAERAIPQMMGEGVEKVDSKAMPIDPESGWLEEKDDAGKRLIPIGWLVLLGLVIVGVTLSIVLQDGKSKESAGNDGAGRLGGAPLGQVGEAMAIDEAARDFARTEEIAKAFLEADSVDAMAGMVRDKKRVLPLMRDFYSRNKLENYKYDEIDEYHIVSLENFPFVALSVQVEGGARIPLLLEDGPDGVKVDWESYICYQPMPLAVFAEKRLVEPTDFRVYAQPDHFYAYEFADEEKYACYKLTTRHSEAILYGYVERGTKLDEEFRKLFPKGPERSEGVVTPLILTLSFLPGTDASRSVLIHAMRSRLWAYPPALGPIENKTAEE